MHRSFAMTNETTQKMKFFWEWIWMS